MLDSKTLDHILIIGRGEEGLLDIALSQGYRLKYEKGKPESISDLSNEGIEKLIAQGNAVRVNKNGTMENGHRHPDVIAKEKDAGVVADDSGTTLPAPAEHHSPSPATGTLVEAVPQEV